MLVLGECTVSLAWKNCGKMECLLFVHLAIIDPSTCTNGGGEEIRDLLTGSVYHAVAAVFVVVYVGQWRQ